MLYKLGKIFLSAFCNLYFSFEISGRENIPVKGGFLLASNHKSNLDPVILGVVSTRKLTFMAKDSLFKVPVFSWVLTHVNAFPVKRNTADTSALKSAIKRINSGGGLLIFPEGTRSESEETSKIQPGIGFIAAKTNAPVVPVFVSGTEVALPKGAKLIRWAKIKITFGKAVSYNKALPYQEIADRIMNNVRSLQS